MKFLYFFLNSQLKVDQEKIKKLKLKFIRSLHDLVLQRKKILC